jgi:hypothetical protein
MRERIRRRTSKPDSEPARGPSTPSALAFANSSAPAVTYTKVDWSKVDVSRPASEPLDASTRVAVESSTGADLSAVRVHADEGAALSAEQLDARAFTLGRDIVFGAGEYAPTTRAGRELIAHEIGHVLQQHSEPDARHDGAAGTEADADAFAQQVVAGRAASVTTVAPRGVALKPKHKKAAPPALPSDRVVAMRIVRTTAGSGQVEVTTSLGHAFHYSLTKLSSKPLMLPPGTFTVVGSPRRGVGNFNIDLPGAHGEQIALKLLGGPNQPAPAELVFAKKLPIELVLANQPALSTAASDLCAGQECVSDDEIERARWKPSRVSQNASKYGLAERWGKMRPRLRRGNHLRGAFSGRRGE